MDDDATQSVKKIKSHVGPTRKHAPKAETSKKSESDQTVEKIKTHVGPKTTGKLRIVYDH